MPPSKAPIQEGPADRRQLLLTIKNKYGALSRASKTIADFILAHHDEAIYLNIRQIAAHCQVSEATVTNFVKAIGLRSFQEFKICMARGAQEEPEENVIYGQILLNDPTDLLCKKVFHSNIDSLNNTLHILDPGLVEDTAQRIIKARRVDFYGQSASAIVARLVVNRLQRIGIRAMVFDDPHMQISSAALLEEGDIAIGISNSGRSREVVAALALARESGAYTIAITRADGSPVASAADRTLLTATNDFEFVEDASSPLAVIALLDALYVCVAAKTKKRTLKNLTRIRQALHPEES
ncbi:MAG: MurR/RpiR family transcriptional regulator [Clostridiales bacterium]|nr:MurR/RpiR family transcriptional regulator [Clostridiales bacterium]